MSQVDMSDVLRTPYVRGGREIGKAGDCLMVTLTGASRTVGCAPDPWPQIRAAWERGDLRACTGFPPCWARMPTGTPPRDGDVLLFYAAHPWSAVVVNGHVYTADEEAGVYCRPLTRWSKQPAEIWRHDPAAHS